MSFVDLVSMPLRHRSLNRIAIPILLAILATSDSGQVFAGTKANLFQAGAHAIDITPQTLPVIINGSFEERMADRIYDPLHARCLVLDDGTERIAIAIIDSCLIPGDVLDEAKQFAHEATGIPTNRMLIAATHTHSAPSVMAVMGSRPDETYRRFLPGRIAQGIAQAAANLEPARIGWTVVKDDKHTHCRRWILRPDKIRLDPYGDRTVRAMMHPGFQNPDYLGPSGPVDPDLSILAVQSSDGTPIALLANYSMHFVGTKPISADYFGLFAKHLEQQIRAPDVEHSFVAMMSQGTSGDAQWMDYGKPESSQPKDMERYAEEMAQVSYAAYRTIRYHDWVPLKMQEKRLTLDVRLPSTERLAQAEKTLAVAEKQNRGPKGLEEIFAREAIKLSRLAPRREVSLQALGIGELGILAFPGEAFGITGLKIKARSPLQPTFIIALANEAHGYVPPPVQHRLGGYTTWAKYHVALEIDAEPKIVTSFLDILEDISGQLRRTGDLTHTLETPYTKAVLASRPLAYYLLNEFEGPQAADVSGNTNDGRYQGTAAFYLDGPPLRSDDAESSTTRAVQFAGGRMKSQIPPLSNQYTVEMWFNNYLPGDARAMAEFVFDPRSVTGYLFSRGPDGIPGGPGDHLAIDASEANPNIGRLLFFDGNALKQSLTGKTDIHLKTWNHAALVRNDKNVTVYLNGNTTPEISGEAEIGYPPGCKELFIGGRCDNVDNFEGRIAHVAVYNRILAPAEIAQHYMSAGSPFRLIDGARAKKKSPIADDQ